MIQYLSSRAMRIEFTPGEETEGAIRTFLAYATVRLDDVEIGAVASRSIVADQMIGSRRRIDLGPATVLRSCIIDGPIPHMHDFYLDELDRLSERVDVLAIGDLQRSVCRGGDRELLVDMPRRTPHRRLAHTAKSG